MNPIKPTIKTELFAVLLIILACLSSIYFYSVFPSKVPIHWNIEGQVDNYSSKEIGAFLFPVVILAMYLMFILIPYLDPKKNRYDEFRKTYHIFKNLMILFMTITYFVASFSAIGIGMSISTWIPIMVGMLFVVLGNYMSKIKPNWFMGIRTPWTLSSEEVWNKTHRFGGLVFILGGLVMMFMPIYPNNIKMILFITIVLLMSLGTTLYSLYLFLKEKNGKNNK
ncbi:hypothetical protein C0583_04475 [Candidatus Parcubacteria bacterium]|nr:MAG: hypothetical protein C0583_04475 [Candidatus Parcubacteria bacterium]